MNSYYTRIMRHVPMLHSYNSNKYNDYLSLIIIRDISSYLGFQEDLNIIYKIFETSE
jgi:hypothetical protein